MHGANLDLADDIIKSVEVDLWVANASQRTEWLNVIGYGCSSTRPLATTPIRRRQDRDPSRPAAAGCSVCRRGIPRVSRRCAWSLMTLLLRKMRPRGRQGSGFHARTRRTGGLFPKLAAPSLASRQQLTKHCASAFVPAPTRTFIPARSATRCRIPGAAPDRARKFIDFEVIKARARANRSATRGAGYARSAAATPRKEASAHLPHRGDEETE